MSYRKYVCALSTFALAVMIGCSSKPTVRTAEEVAALYASVGSIATRITANSSELDGLVDSIDLIFSTVRPSSNPSNPMVYRLDLVGSPLEGYYLALDKHLVTGFEITATGSRLWKGHERPLDWSVKHPISNSIMIPFNQKRARDVSIKQASHKLLGRICERVYRMFPAEYLNLVYQTQDADVSQSCMEKLPNFRTKAAVVNRVLDDDNAPREPLVRALKVVNPSQPLYDVSLARVRIWLTNGDLSVAAAACHIASELGRKTLILHKEFWDSWYAMHAEMIEEAPEKVFDCLLYNVQQNLYRVRGERWETQSRQIFSNALPKIKDPEEVVRIQRLLNERTVSE